MKSSKKVSIICSHTYNIPQVYWYTVHKTSTGIIQKNAEVITKMTCFQVQNVILWIVTHHHLQMKGQHARKDVSMFRVKVSRVLLHHHLTLTTKIKNILSIIYHWTILYVIKFDLTPYIGNSYQLHIKNQSHGLEKYVVVKTKSLVLS